MIWLFAIAILVLLIVSAGFRKFAGVLLAICIAVGLYLYFSNQHEKEASRSRIAASELGFENLVLVPEYSSYKLKGRVTNRSAQYTLSNFTLKLSFQDCTGQAPNESCVTIGESSKFVYVQIPAQQARDLDESVYFAGGVPKAHGRLNWSYVITEIVGGDAT